MRKMNWVSAVVGIALLLPAGAALAAESSPTSSPMDHGAVPSDLDFLSRALRVNQLELAIGQLAVERAGTPEIKTMGEVMVQKHTGLGEQLRDLAQRAGIGGATRLSPEQQSTLVRLSSMSGKDFDAGFKATVDAGHVDELSMYPEEVGHAADPQLAALAQRRVATLEQTVSRAGAPSRDHAKDW